MLTHCSVGRTSALLAQSDLTPDGEFSPLCPSSENESYEHFPQGIMVGTLLVCSRKQSHYATFISPSLSYFYLVFVCLFVCDHHCIPHLRMRATNTFPKASLLACSSGSRHWTTLSMTLCYPTTDAQPEYCHLLVMEHWERWIAIHIYLILTATTYKSMLAHGG